MRSDGLKTFLAVAFFGLLPNPLNATPPVPGHGTPSGKTCFVNEKEATERALAYRAAMRLNQFPAPPLVSNPKVLAIRVDFSDKAMSQSFATAQTFFQNVQTFYKENSYGTFVPTFTVTNCTGSNCGAQGTFRLSGTLAGTYGPNCGSDVACNDGTLLNDSKSATQAGGVDFSGFNQVMILHAGDGEEASGKTTDIWSVFDPVSFSANGKTFSGFSIVPESEAGIADPLGVACHEFGHQQGLPDIYNTATGQPTAGTWSVMDFPYGSVGGGLPGSNPPHLDIWCKLFLGFVSTTTTSGRVVTTAMTGVPLSPSETSANAGFVMFPLTNISPLGTLEYFLAEYRLPAAATYDQSVPASGIVIWHIDDSIASNTTHLTNNDINASSTNGAGHMGVDLVEQNGVEPSGNSGSNAPPQGLSLPKTGSIDGTNGMALSGGAQGANAFRDGNTFSNPQSNTFNGLATGLTIANISGASSGKPTITFDVASLQAASSLSILKVANYPNPAGRDYPPKSAGILTTFVLQTSKPVSTRALDIYDLLGNRVKNVGTDDIKLQVGSSGPSQNLKWVYEFDWDGSNSDGKTIAPAVYLYRFTADNQVKTGKFVVIR